MSNSGLPPELDKIFMAKGGPDMPPDMQKQLIAQLKAQAREQQNDTSYNPKESWSDFTLRRAELNKDSFKQRLEIINSSYDELLLDRENLAYSQNFKEKTGGKAAVLNRLLDPRHKISHNASAFKSKMDDFFKKGRYEGKESPHAYFMRLATQGPLREPSDISYIHTALSNPKWTSPKVTDDLRQIVHTMMEFNFDPNVEFNSEFPIERACRLGDPQIVGSLLQAGAKLNVKDLRGYNPLALAVESGHPELILQLIRYGASPQNTAAGDSPAMLAILRFEKNVKTDPDEAVQTLYKTLGYLKQYGCFNPKAGPSGFSVGSDENKKLEDIRKANEPKFDGMYLDMMTLLDKTEALPPTKITALQKAAPVNSSKPTNIGGLQFTRENHGWFSSFVTMADAMDRKLSAKLSKDITSLVFSCKDDKDFADKRGRATLAGKSLLDFKVQEFRNILNMDVKSDSPPHDTMLHHAARNGMPELFDYCMREECNLHVVNGDGQFPIHLIAQLDDKRTMKLMLSKYAGMINPETGMRESLYEPGKLGELTVLNSNGETFLDILQREHPLWVDEIVEIVEHLGISNELKEGLLQGVPPMEPLVNPATRLLGSSYSAYKPQLTAPVDRFKYDPSVPIPTPNGPSGVSTDEEDAIFTRKKEKDVEQIAAWLMDKTLSADRRNDLEGALKSHLSLSPTKTKISILLSAAANLDLNNDLSDQSTELRRNIVDRVGKELLESFKKPSVFNAYLAEIKHLLPSEEPLHILAQLNALSGIDEKGSSILVRLNDAVEEARAKTFANNNDAHTNPVGIRSQPPEAHAS